MEKSRWIGMAVMVAAVAVVLYGCPKKAEVSSVPEAQPQGSEVAAPAGSDATAKADVEKAAPEAVAQNDAGLKPVYFDFDKAFIREDAKQVLKANAEWLKAHPDVRVLIEGNCDERGTIEYNQALGQRRASATREYLAASGISGKRISLISYGKEKPVCQESSENCWQQNRRAELVPAAK